MEEIDAKILEPVADKLKIKKSSLPKLLIFWGVFGIVLNSFWLINSLYPIPRLFSLDTEPSFWWQYVLYIFFIVFSAIELAYGLKLNRQEKSPRKNQKINALFLLLIPLFLSILLSPLSVISTLHFFSPKKPSHQTACTLEAKICPDGSSVGKTGPNCSFAACPTIAPTSGPIYNVKTYKDTSDFQKYLLNNCKDNKNTVTIPVNSLPIVVNTEKVQLINDDSRGTIMCWLGDDNSGNPISYLQVPYTDSNHIIKTYTIYDQYSKEVGHGGSPAIGSFGLTILNSNHTTLSIFVPRGESGAAIGYTPIVIRGVRLLQTNSGQSWYVSTDILAIKEDDPKLISLLKQYGRDVGGCPAAGCGWQVTDFDGAEKAVAKEFFEDMNHLSPETNSAVEQIEEDLQSISSRI